MKESKFYQKALDMSLLDGKTLKAAIDEKTGDMPETVYERTGFLWRRVGMAAAALLLLLGTTVMAIPSTRAEVLSWLGITRPDEYLSAGPNERPAIEALDNMIATAKPEDTEIKINEIDRTDSKAVNSEGAMRVAELLNQDVQITLGDTLFDGNTAYVTMHLKGTVALPLLDDYTGGSATLVQVDPQRVYDLYENGPGEEYLSGEMPLYERPLASLVLELSDGSTISQFVQNLSETPAYTAYWEHLLDTFDWEHLSYEDMAKISELNLAYLEENEIVSVVEIYCVREQLEKNMDADGTLQAKARYIVSVCEDDDLPETELLNVDLGTVRFNVTGYQAMEARPIGNSDEKVVWTGDTIVTRQQWTTPDDPNDAVSILTNCAVSLDGMSMEALPGAYADALGIYDLKVKITLPDSIQGEAHDAWNNSVAYLPLSFDILIDGEKGDWHPAGFGMIENEDGTLTFHIVDIRGLNLETIDQIRTVTLIPVLRYVSAFVDAEKTEYEIPLNTPTENPRQENGYLMSMHFVTNAYPEYALTFTLG
ncbi:MAG: hypothetical protein IKE11_01480 [Clostridia bacterium]|nr:hypothetical protein [Clostridia bacterium]